jgi:hypothetical protein
LPIARAAGIHRNFQVPEQAWGILDLIDDDWRWITVKEITRLFFCLLSFGGKIERHESIIREEAQKGRSLARLSGSSQYDHGPRLGGAFQARLDSA